MNGAIDAEVSQLSRVAGCDCVVGRPAAAAQSRAPLDARAFAHARTDSEALCSSPSPPLPLPIDNDAGPVHTVRRPCTAPPLDRCSPPSPFRDRAAESPLIGIRERERECDRPAYAHSSYAAQARSEPELAPLRHLSAGRSTVDVGVQHTPTLTTIAGPDAERDADASAVHASHSRQRTERRSMGVQTLRDPPAPPPPPPATAAPTGTSASTSTALAAAATTPPPPLPARQVPPHAQSATEKRVLAISRSHGVEVASDQSYSPFSEPPTPSAVPKAAARKRNESTTNSKETLKSPTLEKAKSVSSASGSISIPSPQSESASKSNLAPSGVEQPAAPSSTLPRAPQKTAARGTSDGGPCAASAGDASSKATAAPPPVPSSAVSTSSSAACTSKLSTAKANVNSSCSSSGAGAAQSTLFAASAADAHSCGAVQPQSRPVSRADELPSVAAVKIEPVTVGANAVHSPLTAHRTLSPASSVGLQRSKSSATSLLVVATLAPTSSTPLPPNEPPATLPRVPTASGGLSLLKHKLSTATGVSFLSGSSTLQERERLERQGRRRSMEVLLNEIYECRRLLLEEKLTRVLQALPNDEPDAARASSRARGAQHPHQQQHQQQQQGYEADAGNMASLESGIERAACAATATAVALSKCNSVLERDAKTAARIAARLTDKGLKGSTTDPDGPAAVRHWVRKYASARISLRIKVIFHVSFS